MATFLLWLLAACGSAVPCIGDPASGDADADGFCDDVDVCGDADGDGTCDDTDPCLGTGADTDGDGVCDDEDPCPLGADSDGDGSCDDVDLCRGDDGSGDTDGDGTCDDEDRCPLDAPDDDDDGDGVCDAWDFCAGHDASGDTDGDGTCDDQDACFGTGADTDGDGVCASDDPCPADALDDSDGDGSCDVDDLCLGDDRAGDTDGDDVCDHLDPCPLDAPDHDDDDDGICDTVDRCPLDPANDADLDGSCAEDDLCLGDDRDGDDDGDAVCDPLDACLGDDATGDEDHDGRCDDLDPCFGGSNEDGDGDGRCDEEDVCPEQPLLPAPCEEAPDGLAHFWPGDGHDRDVVGGADATGVGNVFVDRIGRVHRAFEVTVPTTSFVELPVAVLDDVSSFTVALWIRTSDVGYGLFSVAGPASANSFLIFPQTDTTDVHVLGAAVSVPADLNDMAWHHFAVTRDGTSGVATAYLDGQVALTWTGPTGAIDVARIVLGQDQDNVAGGGLDPNQAFQGRLDELAIWHRALSAPEVDAVADPAGICDPGDTLRGGGDDPHCPTTWFVDADVETPGDGRSWASALAEVEDVVAAPGDQVWITGATQEVTAPTDAPDDTAWLGGFAGSESAPSERDPEATTPLTLSSHAFQAGGWVTFDALAFEQVSGSGAIEAAGAVVLERCSFTGFVQTDDGGAVDAGDVRANGCAFADNHADGAGGAVAAFGRLVVLGSTFEGNTTTSNGGAAYVVGRAYVRDSTFLDNSASLDGGAVYATVSATVRRSWFEGNAATNNGGALSTAVLLVDGSTFVANTAPVDGSALRATSTGDVVGSRFHGHPGKVIRTGAAAQVVQSEFVDNGPGYLLSSPSNCSVFSSTFTGNSSSTGFFLCNAETLKEVVFVGNTAAHDATCTSCCAPGGTVDSGATTLERLDLDDDGLDEVYLPIGSPCRDAGTVAFSNDAPFLPDGWWQTLTARADQSLDADPPDMGRHYVPIP